MSNIKKPPIPIIINLILLSAGYVYCSYALIKVMIETNDWLRGGIPLPVLTIGIIVIYDSVLKRQIRLILCIGTILWLIGISCCRAIVARDCFSFFYLTLAIILWIMGISFIIWGILIFEKDDNSPENISAISKKQKFWLYSAIASCVAGVCFGIIGDYFEENIRIGYELPKNILFILMCSLFIMSIVQFSTYYILYKIRERQEKKINCPERAGTENS